MAEEKIEQIDQGDLQIGIAFGSGGAKGGAHIGILRVLEDHGIKINLIAGTSIGALVGGMYAMGLAPRDIEREFYQFFGESALFSSRNWHYFHESLIREEDINAGFQNMFGDLTFADLKIPFMALALDIEGGKEERITTGPVAKALVAASAIPVLFPPVYIDGKYLVDGGLINATPVDYLREQKMDIVMGVHMSSVTAKQYISAMVWDKYYKKPAALNHKRGIMKQAKLNMSLLINVISRTMDIARKLNSKIAFLTADPDVIIKPETHGMGLLEFKRTSEAVEAGAVAMESEIQGLIDIIKRKKEEKQKMKMAENKNNEN